MTEDEKKEISTLLMADLLKVQRENKIREHIREKVDAWGVCVAILTMMILIWVGAPLWATPTPLFPNIGWATVKSVLNRFTEMDL